MRITGIVTFLALMASVTPLLGQSLYKVLEVGDEAFESRDYYAAFRCYEVVLQEEERFYSKYRTKRYLTLQYGLAAQRFNYFERADSVYSAILDQSEKAGIMDSVYARAVYHLAQTQLIQAGIDSLAKSEADSLYRLAQATFQKLDADLLQQIHEDADYREQYRLGVEAGLENCVFALEKPRATKDTIKRISDPQINSRYSDFAPVWEDSTLYFSSLRYPRRERRQSTIYSRNLEAIYGDSAIITRQLPENDIYNQANRYTNHRAISGNGQWMIFTGCELRNNETVCALYKRRLMPGGGWGAPTPLTLNDPEEDVTHKQPVFMQDCNGQEWLYFSSDREGSEGGSLDIWRSPFDAQSGTVGPVENLGEPVNTRWQEQSPFFFNLTGELYFSSDRPGGYGQHDLFSSEWENGTWQDPKNAGTPLNSGYNDMYYFSVPDGSKVYLSSDRPESMRFIDTLNACCQDIYVMERKVDREIQLDLAQCDNKPSGVGGTRVLVEDVTICGETSVVLDTVVSSSLSSITVPAKRFRKYQVGVSTEGLVQQDSTLLIDFSEDQYEEQFTASVSFSQYPDFLELKLIPDPPRPPVFNEFTEEIIQAFREERIARPFVRSPEGGSLAATATGSPDVFRIPYGETVSVGVEVDSNRNILDLGDNTYYLYTVELEDMIFPMEACQQVCKTEVRVPLLAKSQFSANIYFDNDKPERSPRGYISVTEQRLVDATSNYLNRLPLFTDDNNFKSDSTSQKVDDADGADANSLKSIISRITTKEDAVRAAEDFFDREVKNALSELTEVGEGELTEFGKDLLRALSRLGTDKEIEVEIQGICSTHGNTVYNDSLAVRRIQCITEYLQDVEIDDDEDGVNDRRLGDYLNTSKLNQMQKRAPKGEGLPVTIQPLASGEPEQTVPYFDDMLKNTRFGVAAASDRRVEVSVSITEQDTPNLSVFDLGNGCKPIPAPADSLSSKNPEQ